MKNELFHHGVKGQKWGVKNGPPYPLTRITKGSPKTTNEIYNTLTEKEKHLVSGEMENGKPPKELIKKDDAERLVNQVLVKYGNTPVAALDIWEQGKNEVAFDILTRNGDEYRNKGFAQKAFNEGMKAVEKYKDVEYVNVGIHNKNIPSQNLAKKNGFNDYEVVKHPVTGEEWYFYRKKVK